MTASCIEKKTHIYDNIYKSIGIPVVFDYHHHDLHDGGQTEKEALDMALSTWPVGIRPVVHYSESRADEHNDPKIKPQAHSDYIYKKIETYGLDVDVMVEAKAKERAVQRYKEIWNG